MTSFHPEFGDFPIADMPASIPLGFYDSSWHNDACPSYFSERDGIRIWVNYVDHDLREHEFGTRFAAYQELDDGSIPIAASDNWHEIVDAVIEYQAQAPLVGLCRNGNPIAECRCC